MQANEDELQKALNDITNTTSDNNPGMITTADATEPAAGITPPADTTPAANPTPDVNAMVESITSGQAEPVAVPANPDLGVPAAPPVPDLGMPAASEPSTLENTTPAPENPTSTPENATSTPENTTPTPENTVPAAPAPAGVTPALAEVAPITNLDSQNLDSVKANILRDLAPLMDKIHVEPEKKFELYTDMLAENNDASIVAPAYETARQISDEEKRGEALLSLFEKIEQLEH